jgi:DNA-binding NtrC family response regulator
LSRIASYSMYVPSLSERMEDLDLILDQLERSVRQRTVDYITRVMQVEKLADGDYWAAVKKRVPRLSASERASLAAFDWANHGNLRGLASAVEQVLSRSMPVARALSNLTAVRSRISPPPADLATGFVARLLGRAQSDRGLAAHVGDVESEVRSEIRDKLKGDPGLISKLSTQLRIPTESLIAQLSQLDRTRRRTR